MASRVAGKIKLQSVDELLGVPEIAGTQEIEIERIHAFPNHPFKVLDDEKIKKITIAMAVDLSYLDEQVQKWVYEYFKENGFLKPVQVEALKNYPNLSNVTQFSVISIMNDALPKKSKESKLSFSAKKLDKYFPPQYSTKERENIIIQLLEQWSADQIQSE